MLQYIILNNALEKLVSGDEIIFYLPNEKTYRGQISLGNTGYYCYLSNTYNSKIFEKLEIYDANDFVKKIVGYDCKGDWPEVKTLDDLKKVIKALDDKCIKKWRIQHNSTEPNRNTSQFKVGDKVKILPRNGSEEDYYPVYTNGMQKYVGRLTTITSVNQHSCKIKLDGSIYFWPLNALQLITSEIDKTVDPHNLKNGDYIKITYNELFYIYIVNRVENNAIYRHAAYYSDDGSIDVNPGRHWYIIDGAKITYATEEEKKMLDDALIKEGYIWNDLTKQLDCIGLVNAYPSGISIQTVDFSSFPNSIQKANDITNLLKCTKKETQTETELNLFPTKKHYQLNFNY